MCRLGLTKCDRKDVVCKIKRKDFLITMNTSETLYGALIYVEGHLSKVSAIKKSSFIHEDNTSL